MKEKKDSEPEKQKKQERHLANIKTTCKQVQKKIITNPLVHDKNIIH